MDNIDAAWEELAKADKETEENLKEDEALFKFCGAYTIKKKDVDEISAIIWNPDESDENDYRKVLSASVQFFEDEDELDRLEDEFGYKFPTGLFRLKCWGYETQSMTDCGIEYDYEYSRNYEISKISDKKLIDVFQDYSQLLDNIKRSKELAEEGLEYLDFGHFIADGDVRRGIDDCCNCLNEIISL